MADRDSHGLTSGNADMTVNDATTYQPWDGFGGTFNEAGWHVLSTLERGRGRAIKLLFDTHGARFAFGRIPIGASDYAIDRYTLNETPNDTRWRASRSLGTGRG